MRRTTLAAAAIVVAAAVIPYAPLAGDYFIQDDFGVVALLSQKPWSAFPRWFVSTWMDDIWGYTPDEIRPFPAFTYQVAALWGAASPVANHVVNIAFHAANGLLVFGMARATAGLGLPASLAAAVLFVLLPMQAESVAWITGRVDSMPACFYMAAFLLFVRWRAGDGTATYAGAVACCFVALFSKQNAITLPAALIAYDVLFPRQQRRSLAAAASAHLPFAALTIGYLALRWMLFGEVAREGMLTADRLTDASAGVALHLKRMIYGEPGVSMETARALGIAGGALTLLLVGAWRAAAQQTHRLLVTAIYFLVVWIGLGLAPTLVAGYTSPRHMYLASAGWAIGLALLANALWSARLRWVRWAATAAVVAGLAAYAVQLQTLVSRWHARAAVSRQAVADVEREVMAAPPGALILAGAPRASWEFAIPHALRPPFTTSDVTVRASVITVSSLYCCPAERWDAHTRQQLRDWAGRAERPPVIALYWDPQTGALTRVTDTEESSLAVVPRLLADTGSRAALDEAIADTFSELVIPRVRP